MIDKSGTLERHKRRIAELEAHGQRLGLEFISAQGQWMDELAAMTAERDRAEQQVKELLWDDPEDIPSFGPAFGDLLCYLNHQDPFPSEIYKMMSGGAKKWAQLKAERDELSAEWIYQRSAADRYHDQLAASQAREQQLRGALQIERDTERRIGVFKSTVETLALPSGTTALDERLQAERERVIKVCELWDVDQHCVDEIWELK
jgi:hypothetical protein